MRSIYLTTVCILVLPLAYGGQVDPDGSCDGFTYSSEFFPKTNKRILKILRKKGITPSNPSPFLSNDELISGDINCAVIITGEIDYREKGYRANIKINIISLKTDKKIFIDRVQLPKRGLRIPLSAPYKKVAKAVSLSLISSGLLDKLTP